MGCACRPASAASAQGGGRRRAAGQLEWQGARRLERDYPEEEVSIRKEGSRVLTVQQRCKGRENARGWTQRREADGGGNKPATTLRLPEASWATVAVEFGKLKARSWRTLRQASAVQRAARGPQHRQHHAPAQGQHRQRRRRRLWRRTDASLLLRGRTASAGGARSTHRAALQASSAWQRRCAWRRRGSEAPAAAAAPGPQTGRSGRAAGCGSAAPGLHAFGRAGGRVAGWAQERAGRPDSALAATGRIPLEVRAALSPPPAHSAPTHRQGSLDDSAPALLGPDVRYESMCSSWCTRSAGQERKYGLARSEHVMGFRVRAAGQSGAGVPVLCGVIAQACAAASPAHLCAPRRRGGAAWGCGRSPPA